MKTIKHLLEEARTSASSPDKEDTVDSYRALSRKEEIPMMLVFKRQNIRNMNGIKVGLYYSPVLGKFITIPFGGKDSEQGIGINEEYNVDMFDLAKSGARTAAKAYRGVKTIRKAVRDSIENRVGAAERDDPEFQKRTNPKGFEDRANREIKNYVSAVKNVRQSKAEKMADPAAFRANTKTNLRYDVNTNKIEQDRITPMTNDVNQAMAAVRRLKHLGIEVPVVKKNTQITRAQRKAELAAANPKQAPTTPKRSPNAVKPPAPAGALDENAGAILDVAKASIMKLRQYLKKRKEEKDKGNNQPGNSSVASSGQRHVAGEKSRVEVNRAGHDSSSASAENYRRKSIPAINIQESNLQKVHRLAITNGIDNTRIGFRNSRGETLVDKNQARSIAQLYESLSPKNKTKMEGMISESADTYKKVLEFALKGTMNG